MRKNITCIFLFLFFLGVSQQKFKILDKETLKPINNARLMVGNLVAYTNDDGEVEISLDKVSNGLILVSAPSYEDGHIIGNESEAYLQPKYKEI